MNDSAATHFFTDTLFVGIPLFNWLLASAVAVVSFLAMRVAVGLVRRRLSALAERSESFVGRLAYSLAEGTSNTLLLLAAILIGLNVLDLPAKWLDRVGNLWFAVIVLQVGLWLNRVASLGLRHHLKKHASDREPGQLGALSTIVLWTVRVALWTIVLLAILSNLGVNITAFIASLGVGGIAIALAVQNILGDLFASLSIAIDKPFEVGDFIVVDSWSGTVEHVGLKTTRIRSLGGEQIVMSNASMLTQTIQNFKRLAERRVVFEFGVTYDCTSEQAREIPRVVENHPGRAQDALRPQPFPRFRGELPGFRDGLHRAGPWLQHLHGYPAGHQPRADGRARGARRGIRLPDADRARGLAAAEWWRRGRCGSGRGRPGGVGRQGRPAARPQPSLGRFSGGGRPISLSQGR